MRVFWNAIHSCNIAKLDLIKAKKPYFDISNSCSEYATSLFNTPPNLLNRDFGLTYLLLYRIESTAGNCVAADEFMRSAQEA